VLRIIGPEAVQLYLVEEVRECIARRVNINDKHIEVIIRQMLRKVRSIPWRHEFSQASS
jgi:DNA-directed RNA polymerase subunit beta'